MPEHWRPLSKRALVKKRKVLVGTNHNAFTLLSLTKRGVIVRDIESGKGRFSEDMGTCQEVRKGDFVFCLFDVPETTRTVGLSKHDGMIMGAYTAFAPNSVCYAPFFELFYLAMDDGKLLSPLYFGLRNTIPPPRFLGAKTPYPPLPEQAAIAKYLKQATADISGAIDRARREIELFREYRTGLIAGVVTGKLDVREAVAKLPDFSPESASLAKGVAISDSFDPTKEALVR